LGGTHDFGAGVSGLKDPLDSQSPEETKREEIFVSMIHSMNRASLLQIFIKRTPEFHRGGKRSPHAQNHSLAGGRPLSDVTG
jgi:hypothetical protein